jgi:hypothetical protein
VIKKDTRTATDNALAVSRDDESVRSYLRRVLLAVERLVILVEKGKVVTARDMDRIVPTLWDMESIAEWMGINRTTAKLHVLNRTDFPEPFRPTGKTEGQKRWFRDEVVAFARTSGGRQFLKDAKADQSPAPAVEAPRKPRRKQKS